MKFRILCLLISILFVSCTFFENKSDEEITVEAETPQVEEPVEEPVVEEPEPEPEEPEVEPPEFTDIENNNQIIQKERQWTIFVYMPADNNLESSAIEDLLEMEHSSIDTDVISIFVLLDRSKSYNTSNDNWTGTRLYKIKSESSSDSLLINSTWVDCPALGLAVGVDTELDMSSPYVLSSAIEYVCERYPAEHYGVFMWGHGTGWRSDYSFEAGATEQAVENFEYKGIAFDENSGTYMTLAQLGKSIETATGNLGYKLDLIGFDTCYGGEIEVMYELKDCAKYGLGSEGLVSNTGWDYEKLFDYFSGSDKLTAEALCDAIIKQFSEKYTYLSRASIVGIDLSIMEDYLSAFNNYCLASAEKITTVTIHDDLMKRLYTSEDNSTEIYTYGKAGYDVYLDVASLADTIQGYFTSTKKGDDLVGLYSIYRNYEQQVIYDGWASDREKSGLGIYFSTLTTGGILSSSHPSSYINGKTNNQIKFVQACSGYVPAARTGNSILDKMFYTNF